MGATASPRPATWQRRWRCALACRSCSSCAYWSATSWGGSSRPAYRSAVESGLQTKRATQGALSASAFSSHPVDDDVEAEPDDVHEVPVPGGAFEAEVALRREVAPLQAQRDEQQHQHADEHVEAVEAGQHEEGRAED